MRRKDATLRLEELLTNIEAGDLDLEIVITPDEQYPMIEVLAFSGHPHPSIDLVAQTPHRRRDLT